MQQVGTQFCITDMFRAMTTPTSDTGGAADDQWAADMLYGSVPSAAPSPESLCGAEGADGENSHDTVDLDVSRAPDQQADVNAGARKTAKVLGGALVVAAVAVTAALLIFGQAFAEAPSPHSQVAAATPVATPQASTTIVSTADTDQAIRFTASADCPAGSSSARALTDAASDSAWVCVRGTQGATVDGQVLHVDLGGSFLLTAVSVTPGWVAKMAGGKDEWLQHRVVTRLQYVFDDDSHTIFTQDTGNTHGPVTTPLPKKVLASRVTVIVLQTSRPPASMLPQTSVSQPGFTDSVLGAGGAPLAPDASQTADPDSTGTAGNDPVDATFAMSELKIFGHQPN
jgi:hypothetical protein